NHEDRTPSYLESVKNSTEPADVELHATAKAVIIELLNVLPGRLLEEQKKPSNKKKTDDTPLYSSATILSLLAELIRSYQSVAKIVCEHLYPRGTLPLISDLLFV